jgi:protein SCO1
VRCHLGGARLFLSQRGFTMRVWAGMNRAMRAGASVFAAMALALAVCVSLLPGDARAQPGRWHGEYFPNIVLQDQTGKRVRFYDDLIRGKVVVINFIYTECTSICPLDTAQLKRVQNLLGKRIGRDVFMYSISINPRKDTPASLARFMRVYDVGPGWQFLTGDADEIAMLQSRLGISPPDPNKLSEHDTSIIMGNEKTGQWIKRSSFENPQNIANILGETLHNYTSVAPPGANGRQSFAVAGAVTDTSQGIYLFRTRCASCHTIGGGDRLGPDLKGVASSRNPAWLSRWIQQPDKMIAERDPIALALMARYRNLAMPNLSLGKSDAEAIISYMRAQDAPAAPSGRTK